jgi:hypothetical protein
MPSWRIDVIQDIASGWFVSKNLMIIKGLSEVLLITSFKKYGGTLACGLGENKLNVIAADRPCDFDHNVSQRPLGEKTGDARSRKLRRLTLEP